MNKQSSGDELLAKIDPTLDTLAVQQSDELDSVLIALTDELVADLQDVVGSLLRALFQASRTPRPDLRQNAFGLVCGLVDETLRPLYDEIDGALGRNQHDLFLVRWTTPRKEAGGIRLYPSDLSHVYTGWNAKRLGETLYSYEEMVSGGRDVGFLQRFLLFTLIGAKTTHPAYPPDLPRVATLHSRRWVHRVLLALDMALNPRTALRLAYDRLSQRDDATNRDDFYFSEVAGALWAWAREQTGDEGWGNYQDTWLRVFRVLAFALAKSVYDGASPLTEAPLFLPPVPVSQGFTAVPILHLQDDYDVAESLWLQFNKVSFLEDKLSQGLDVGELGLDAQNQPLPDERPELKESTFDTVMPQLEARLASLATVGITRNEVFPYPLVSYARIDLPLFRFRWVWDELGDFRDTFFKALKEATGAVGHIVFLVGPYGTAKTTIAQHLFSELVEQAQGDWFILSYKPERGLFTFDWVPKDEAIKTFRVNELSRLLSDDMMQRVEYNLPFNKKGIVNLSELNAGDPQAIRASLLLIEKLIREIKEKLLPDRFVLFVSLQMYQLAKELKTFFETRPDLTMGRGRLDTAWLVRGDVYQYKHLATSAGSVKEEYLKELAAFIADVPSQGSYIEDLVRRTLMPGDEKAARMFVKVKDLELTMKSQGRSYDDRPLRVFERLLQFVSASEGDSVYLRQWAVEFERLDIFKSGLGTMATTTLALANGFIRQVIDILRNELEFDILEWKVITDLAHRGEQRWARNENLVRSRLYNQLPAMEQRLRKSTLRFLTDDRLYRALDKAMKGAKEPEVREEVWKETWNKQLRVRRAESPRLYGRLLRGNDDAISVMGRIYGKTSDAFDLGLVLDVAKRDGWTELYHYLMDINTSARQQQTEKGKPTLPRVVLAWEFSKDREGDTPPSLGIFLGLLRELTTRFVEFRPTGRQETLAIVEEKDRRLRHAVFTVDFSVDGDDPLRVRRFYITYFPLDQARAQVRDAFQPLLEDIGAYILRERKERGEVFNLRLDEWQIYYGDSDKDIRDDAHLLVSRDDLLREALYNRWGRDLRLALRYVRPNGDFIQSHSNIFAEYVPLFGLDEEAQVREPDKTVSAFVERIRSGHSYSFHQIQKRLGELAAYPLLDLDAVTDAASFEAFYERLKRLYWLVILVNTGKVHRGGRTIATEKDAADLAAPFPPGTLWDWMQAKLDDPDCQARDGAKKRAERLLIKRSVAA
jgi:hypothetical protein